jgi:uncharacterized protein YbbK (DUF523 family)
MRELFARPELRIVAFCPEQHALGTPRAMPDIHGGDGFDVVAGRARVLAQPGGNVTLLRPQPVMSLYVYGPFSWL